MGRDQQLSLDRIEPREKRRPWHARGQQWTRVLAVTVVMNALLAPWPAVMASSSSKFEIELLLADGPYVIGVANDAESALNVLDEAMRQYPTGHI
jgi:hypothetical protein